MRSEKNYLKNKMDILKDIYRKAKLNRKKIVLPEGEESRVLLAAERAAAEGIADLVLLGRKNKIEAEAKNRSLDISKIEIIDYLNSDKFEHYVDIYYKRRKHANISRKDAVKVIKHPVFYAAMMLKDGLVDGFVAGSVNTSGDVAKAAIHCVGADKRSVTVSSSFIMIIPNCRLGNEGLFIFADCGVVPNPSSKQLCNIAISTADLMEQVCGLEPRVAMLSYSTKSSASGQLVDKVREATMMIQEKRPDLLVDGELQVDAAIVPEVAKIKSPKSKLAGRANILIFPDLEAGNISYKLVQRLAGAKAIGPLLQGLNKPCSDLSRGCNVEDIIDAIVVTAVRSR